LELDASLLGDITAERLEARHDLEAVEERPPRAGLEGAELMEEPVASQREATETTASSSASETWRALATAASKASASEADRVRRDRLPPSIKVRSTRLPARRTAVISSKGSTPRPGKKRAARGENTTPVEVT